jgi:urea transporter
VQQRAAILAPRLTFLARILKGHAQVTFLPSTGTGLLFGAALFTAGWAYGLYGLLGTAVGTATAHALGVDRARLDAGLEGFNACLVATGCAVFLGPGRIGTLLLAIGGAVVVTVVTGALAALLGAWNIPTFTIPFCLVASAITVAAPGLRPAAHSPAAATAGPAHLTPDDLWHAFFANLGQIFFMPQWYVGALLLLGVFAASRVAGAVACLGSTVGIATAWALGSPAADIAHGVMGYNAVLTAMALCGVFIAADRWSLGYAVVGAAAATALTAATAAFLAPSGGHALTWPFALTALVFVAAVPSFPRLRRN